METIDKALDIIGALVTSAVLVAVSLGVIATVNDARKSHVIETAK